MVRDNLNPGRPPALLGPISVSLVVVSGSDHHLVENLSTVVAQVQKGCQFLTDVAGEQLLKFRLETHHCHVVPDLSSARSDEEVEMHWKAQALSGLGFSDAQEMALAMQNRDNSEHAIVVWISKLPVEHFAFALNNEITLSYYGGDYGVSNLHALLVHEICHVFGAEDEIGECHCNSRHGINSVEHGNCYVCNPKPEPCIMAANALRLCSWTKLQLGWPVTHSSQGLSRPASGD